MSTPESPIPRPRLDSVDLLRGLIMALMVLDHTRDFFTNARFDASDLSQTTPAIFFTRWVTHFCAPGFMFLAGVGASLAGSRGMSKPALARFLATRGLWLIFLELTVSRLGLVFNLDYRFIPLIVLWAIGCSMLVLSALIFLPQVAIAAFGLVMIAGHNLLDGLSAEQLHLPRALWTILHNPGRVPLMSGRTCIVMYPLVPWIGVMAIGYAFGPLLRLEPSKRRRELLSIGLGATLAFIALRASNVYGDPFKWSYQSSPLFTLMSFINCLKYPPSLLYLLMTLGPAIALLALLDRPVSLLARPLLVFGRVPLFFYLLQWPVLHALAIAIAAVNGQPSAWIQVGGPFGPPPGYGYDLPFTYLMWAVTLALLYPPCRWFADLKRRRSDWWLSYL
ncbi:MAG TPA: heparan-alpha-glucosaminide N-acetyltransferase domain-containing protein [Isosphaeraceae bacterium]|nr:heparan-alpha-glucosaminide N-acetyltransferase domain-containing protein [Isosphaeraceae bacterium]